MADFKNKNYFDLLQDFIQGGSKEALSKDEQDYLDLLSLINSLRRKYGKENAIAFIQHKPYNIPYAKARTMYEEAINLFYGDDGIEKQAHRNALYEELIAASKVVLLTAKSSKDMEVYGDLVTKAYKIKGLDTIEPPKIPEALYAKPLKIYSLDPGQISIQRADRNALAQRIDDMEISDIEKNRVRQESGVQKVDFLELYDEQEKKTESQA